MKQTDIEKLSQKRNFYRDLDLNDYSDLKKIKKKYRDLAKKYHPDKLLNKTLAESKDANDRFEIIKEAYEILSKQKGDYDIILRRLESKSKIEKEEIIEDSRTFLEHLSKYEIYLIHRQIYIDKYVSDNDACKFMIFNVIIGGISVLYPSFFTIILSPFLLDSLFRIIQIWTKFPIKRAGLIEFLFEKFGL